MLKDSLRLSLYQELFSFSKNMWVEIASQFLHFNSYKTWYKHESACLIELNSEDKDFWLTYQDITHKT